MKTNLKVILSAVGVAALLAAPAMAKTARFHASTKNIPIDARGSVAPYGVNEGGPYTPSMPTTRHGLSADFQNANGN
jgi:hypothetical protein